MLVSYKWLQKYFKEKLPAPEVVADALTFHAFEIEDMKSVGDDTIFDVKVLPDRAHYALSHQGIAKEVSAILKLEFLKSTIKPYEKSDEVKKLNIEVQDSDVCPRYIGRRIENIKVEDSPEWLKEFLLNLNQRSINSIVDAANYVMLDTGQPLHAFDADKVVGKIVVRYAQEGEKITTLDNREISLDPSMLIISDEEGPLALAGIKGGKKAEVTKNTKNIIIESANFDPVLTRKTSTKVNIKTDASKRYENGITSEFALMAMEEVTSLIAEMNPEARIGNPVDQYLKIDEAVRLRISLQYINEILGTKISKNEVFDIFNRLSLVYAEDGECIYVTPPFERLDLHLPQDIVEEVGRLYGYEKIKPRLSDFIKSRETNGKEGEEIINQKYLWIERIREILVAQGFSEVFTSSLSARGHFEIEKSASDKNFLRDNLSGNISKALETNLYNAPLLGLSQIKIFEVGKVFPEKGEYTSLCIGIANSKNHKGEYDSVNEEIRQTREYLISKLSAKLTTVCTIDDTGGVLILKGKPIGKINEIDGVMEFDLDALIKSLNEFPMPEQPIQSKNREDAKEEKKYKPISQYPFVLRDIAVFVPTAGDEDIKEKEVEARKIIEEQGTDLLVRTDIFDIFTKTFKDTGEVKTSYGFRLVFQANDRTLTDEEINKIMEKIADTMNGNADWQVR
jgi:phenylalanyl-tRNA synthetase beta chain